MISITATQRRWRIGINTICGIVADDGVREIDVVMERAKGLKK